MTLLYLSIALWQQLWEELKIILIHIKNLDIIQKIEKWVEICNDKQGNNMAAREEVTAQDW